MSVYLPATLAALACGPVLYALARPRPRLRRVFDVAVWIGVLALLALETLPEGLAVGGIIGASFFLLGLLGPSALEHGLRSLARETHLVALLMALAGLAVHAIADGAVLAAVGPGQDDLGAAVALHSLPIGLAICWVAIPALGWPRALAVLLAVAVATLFGYAVTPDLKQWLGPTAWAWTQMAVAGLLLHALAGRPHAHPPPSDPPQSATT